MKKQIWAVLLLIVVLSGQLMISCSKGNSYGSGNNYNPPPPTSATVTTTGMIFNPANLSVKAGTSVTFTNNDTYTHTFTADDNSFDSGDIAPGYSYTRTFSSAGTFHYHCKHHANMLGIITVTP